MKAFLMFRDKDFEPDRALPPQSGDLTRDLGLERLFTAMADGDEFLYAVAQRAVLLGLSNPQEILYRQQVLQDCLAQSAIVQEIYAIAVEAIQAERKVYRSLFRYPNGVLQSALDVMELFVPLLKRLRAVADAHAGSFRSAGFTAFFATLQRELDDAYFQRIQAHLKELRFRNGVLISARLGQGNKGTDYVLRKLERARSRWREWIPFLNPSPYTLVIPERDESGMQALSELRDRGINLAANALAQSADHILSFFELLRAELGFYIGCLNLWRQLAEKGEPICFPVPTPCGRPELSACGLYDVCLSLRLEDRVVGNDVEAGGKRLVMITGANQGGKSTFLRSIGLAQLMMQCGMFVAAEAFRADVRAGIFTHFKREEDPTMRMGKLDEELSRMRAIAERLTPNSLVLCNESFAATNEREGAEIAGMIVHALMEAGVKVCFVTHSFELANSLYHEGLDTAHFLRAERLADGRRTFHIIKGEPLPTSYGEDLYRRIFGASPEVEPKVPQAFEREWGIYRKVQN